MEKSRRTVSWRGSRFLCTLPAAFRGPVTYSTTKCFIFSAQLCIIQTKKTYKLRVLQTGSLAVQPSKTDSLPFWVSHSTSEFVCSRTTTRQLATGHQLICHTVLAGIFNWYLDKELKFNLAHLYLILSLTYFINSLWANDAWHSFNLHRTLYVVGTQKNIC